MTQTPVSNTDRNGNATNTPIFDQLMWEFQNRGQHVNEIMERPINTEPASWNSFAARRTVGRDTVTGIAVDRRQKPLSDGAKKLAEERAASKELAIRIVDKRPVTLPEFEHQLKTDANARLTMVVQADIDDEDIAYVSDSDCMTHSEYMEMVGIDSKSASRLTLVKQRNDEDDTEQIPAVSNDQAWFRRRTRVNLEKTGVKNRHHHARPTETTVVMSLNDMAAMAAKMNREE